MEHKHQDQPEGASPIEWEPLRTTKLEEEIKLHRWMNCPHYSKCLNHAAQQRWPGWSCYWCPLNPFGELGTEEATAQIDLLTEQLRTEDSPHEQWKLKQHLKKWLLKNK